MSARSFQVTHIYLGDAPHREKVQSHHVFISLRRDYKKDIGKINSKELHRLEVGSKTSGSIGNNPSIIGQPITTIKNSMLKKSQLVNCLGNTSEN